MRGGRAEQALLKVHLGYLRSAWYLCPRIQQRLEETGLCGQCEAYPRSGTTSEHPCFSPRPCSCSQLRDGKTWVGWGRWCGCTQLRIQASDSSPSFRRTPYDLTDDISSVLGEQWASSRLQEKGEGENSPTSSMPPTTALPAKIFSPSWTREGVTGMKALRVERHLFPIHQGAQHQKLGLCRAQLERGVRSLCFSSALTWFKDASGSSEDPTPHRQHLGWCLGILLVGAVTVLSVKIDKCVTYYDQPYYSNTLKHQAKRKMPLFWVLCKAQR
ncbi:hypothetical protein Anapl_00299 [Anas platyrhynchos]|uniref:Uncharacterized protein n=1 Tax=Anas platyrhynchos TaxID=8839 RepID=R0LQL8_ANAPL|nr:hypothetical protein Anapl_00299 [Anas platyrhynchos]